MVGFTGSKRLLEKAWQGSHMTIDDDTLKQLLRINDALFQLCKRLNEKQEIEISVSPDTARGRPHPYLVRRGQEQTSLSLSDSDFLRREAHVQIANLFD